jgi:hypothetical protein
MGPVMTDVIALLGRGAFFSAPFRNLISSACLPARCGSGPRGKKEKLDLVRFAPIDQARGCLEHIYILIHLYS